MMGALPGCTGACAQGWDRCDCNHRPAFLDFPPTTGWRCPVCNRGNAPHADKCGHCAERITTPAYHAQGHARTMKEAPTE